MKTISVTQLKANPSAYLKLLESGQSILLLERKTPIAILEPAAPEDDEDAFRKRLVELGIVAPFSGIRR